MPHAEPNRDNYLTTERLAALTDGVFAIAMTILVLELRIPLPTESEDLPAFLLNTWPVFAGYVASFINLGIYWVSQYNQFHYIRYTDRVYLWMHLFFLLFVTLVPFSTAIMGRYPDEQLSYIVYGCNLLATGCISYFTWGYATQHHRLVRHDIQPEIVSIVKSRILFAPILSICAILLSFVTIRSSLFLYMLIPPYYIWPRKYDKNWHRPAIAHDHDEDGNPIL